MFDIEDKEKYAEWTKNHKCHLTEPNSSGAIGGRLTFKFTPTSLGVVSVVVCACGEECDTTIYGDW